jgi:hypothetical protein
MQKRCVVAVLIVCLLSSTMVPGCSSLTGIFGLASGGGPLGQFAIIPLQFIGAILLDQFVGPLLGDPAGDLGRSNSSGDNTGNVPPDN